MTFTFITQLWHFSCRKNFSFLLASIFFFLGSIHKVASWSSQISDYEFSFFGRNSTILALWSKITQWQFQAEGLRGVQEVALRNLLHLMKGEGMMYEECTPFPLFCKKKKKRKKEKPVWVLAGYSPNSYLCIENGFVTWKHFHLWALWMEKSLKPTPESQGASHLWDLHRRTGNKTKPDLDYSPEA